MGGSLNLLIGFTSWVGVIVLGEQLYLLRARHEWQTSSSSVHAPVSGCSCPADAVAPAPALSKPGPCGQDLSVHASQAITT